MWAGVQAFVLDHGFPYSSQRIQDLSTLLTSSTALIWFIDTYEYFHRRAQDLQRPLHHYQRNTRVHHWEAVPEEAYASLKTLTSSGANLIRSGGPEGVPFTRVEEQAMAVMIAAQRGDWEMADTWLQGLLNTRIKTTRPNGAEHEREYEEFPPIVDSRDGRGLLGSFPHTGAQMMVYYALGRYLDPRFAGSEARSPTVEAEVRRVLAEGLHTMVDLYWEPLNPEVEEPLHYDMFLFGAPAFEQPRMRTTENVLAYFALQQAERVGVDIGGFFNADWMGRLEKKVSEACAMGLISGRSDLAGPVKPVAVRAAAERPRAFCLMFYAHTGRFEEAMDDLRLVEDRAERASFLARPDLDGSLSSKSIVLHESDVAKAADNVAEWILYSDLDHVTRPHLWSRLLQEGLPRRALASIDPRQEELAIGEFGWLRSLRGESAFYHLAVLLLHHPEGVFGVEAGPLFTARGQPEPELLWPDAEPYLGRLQLDAIRTLLVSDASPQAFDSLLDRVSAVMFATVQAQSGISPSLWQSEYIFDRETWILRADTLLSSLCEHGPPNEHVQSYEAYFGLACEDLSALYVNLRTARFGGKEGLVVELLAGSEPFMMAELLEAVDTLVKGEWHVLRKTAASGFKSDGDCVTCALPIEPVKNDDQPAPTQLQERMREALILAQETRFLEQGRYDQEYGRPSFRFLLRGIDSIDAVNPSAPSYWSERAIVLRAIIKHRDGLRFDPPVPLRALGLPQTTETAEHVRWLREQVNRNWNGLLNDAASAFDLPPGRVHRAMQIGFVEAPDQEAPEPSAADSIEKTDSEIPPLREVSEWLANPSATDEEIAEVVARLIEEHHYSGMEVDNNVSARFFEEYFRRLDPNKYFFLQSDFDEFLPFQQLLDEQLKNGSLEFAFAVYKRLLLRIRQRVEFVHQTSAGELDFSKQESLIQDRESASWAKTTAELDDIWRKRIKNQLLLHEFWPEEQDGFSEIELAPQEKVRTRYRNYYQDMFTSDSADVLEYYLTSLLQVFDAHSRYLNWRSAEDFDIRMSLSLHGIGVAIESVNGYAKVVYLEPGGPAALDGQLQPGVRIIAVARGEGPLEDVVDVSSKKIARKIRSPAGTKITLSVLRTLTSQPITVTLQTGIVERESKRAQGKVLTWERSAGPPFAVGIIEIPGFYADFKAIDGEDPDATRVSGDVRRIIDTMIENNEIDGIVLDLRFNSGGSLEETIKLTGLFIPHGPAVQVRYAKKLTVRDDDDGGFFYKMPLVVLVNRSSVSAAEIFSAAIQDYGRGIVVGDQRTHGKGTVQTNLRLSRLPHFEGFNVGVLKYTTAKFYRVTGGSTQLRGVTPDVIFPSYLDHEEIGEETKKNALPWDVVTPQKIHKAIDVSGWIEGIRQRSRQRREQDVEYQALVASIDEYGQQNKQTLSLNREERQKQARENEHWSSRFGAIFGTDGEDEDEHDGEDLHLNESIHILVDLIELVVESKR